MLAGLRQRLTYANIMATIAVFMALGGSAYAAVVLPANSVGSKQIKNRAVTLAKIGSSARRALHGQRGVRGPRGLEGQQGAQGPQAPQGPQGPQGGPGAPGQAGSQGPAGTARAYGLVTSTGTLVAGKSKNIATVTSSGDQYCITPSPGINVASVEAVANVDYGDSGSTADGFAQILHQGSGGCPAGALEVITRTPAGGHVEGFFFLIP